MQARRAVVALKSQLEAGLLALERDQTEVKSIVSWNWIVNSLLNEKLNQITPSNIITSTSSPSATSPCSWRRTIRPLACTIELKTPDP